MRQSREFAAIALWATAIASMIYGTIDSVQESHIAIPLAWGIFLAIAACVPTVWAIMQRELEQEDVTVERIAGVVDALHEAKRDLHSV